MADPLSVSAGIAGLVSLGIQVTGSLVKFYTSYKNQDADVARTTTNLDNLLGTFQFLHTVLQARTFPPDERDMIKNIESSVQRCEELIEELQAECEKFDSGKSIGFKDAIKTASRRAAYPFRQSTLAKLDEDIGEIRENLKLALDVLDFGVLQNTQDDVTEIKGLVELMRATQVTSGIRDWLKAPDATTNHNAACAKRHPGTGNWFVKDAVFRTWLTQDNSFLWLNGFAGCGKSVLCSTAIQHTFRHKQSNRGVGIGFFYFTFNDASKQDESAMLRALLLQLSGQLSGSETDLGRLHDSYSTSIPPTVVLVQHLEQLVRKFNQVYILLDALDESPRYDQRDQVLGVIETMRNWLFPGLHLLTTSRDELDIRESLNPTPDKQVIMKNSAIEKDIRNFVSRKLSTDPRLRKWSAYHDRIQRALANRAQGVFRWVECQFEALKRCPRSESHLEHCLQSLPENLDKTYERLLRSIDKGSVDDARRILTLLCLSSRPLTIDELIEGIAVDLREPAHLDPGRRLHDADDIRRICPRLIDISFEKEKKNKEMKRMLEKYEANANEENDEEATNIEGNNGIERLVPTIRIAHFSVQEYLESSRIREQSAANFALTSPMAHAEIAKIFLVYLQEPELSTGTLDLAKLKRFPLACFAAESWHHHYQNATGIESTLHPLMLETSQTPNFRWFLRLNEAFFPFRGLRLIVRPSSEEFPVFCAALFGLAQFLQELIGTQGQESVNDENGLKVAESDLYGNALQAAAFNGHEGIVETLLNMGADVNAQSGMALQAASYSGYEKIVKTILDAGADVTAQGGEYGNALRAALYSGHEKVIQMLLDAGANVNAQGGRNGNALHAASVFGYEKVVQMLLDAGADVTAQGGEYGNALQAASYSGHEKLVQMLLDGMMLLDAGANVNAHGGYYGNALQAAREEGHGEVVKMLIAAGAVESQLEPEPNVNMEGDELDSRWKTESLHSSDVES